MFSASAASLKAQLNNAAFQQSFWNEASGKTPWGLTFDNLNFVRNTEYQSHITAGRTLLGTQLLPAITFRAFDSVQLTAGVFIQQEAGNNKPSQLLPVYSVQIRQNNHLFIFGTLQGNLNHKLIEPLYAFDRVITNRIESGLQHIYNSRRINSDIWVDWEKMIYPGSKFREEFTAGWSGSLHIIDKPGFKWSFPIQTTVHHRGGEIDVSGLPVETQFNFAYGTKMRFTPSDSLLKYIELQGYLTYYEDLSRMPADSFIDGLGQYVSLLFQGKNLGLMFNYWDSHQFQSVMGDQIFQSLSQRNPAIYTASYRKMVQARLLYEKELYPNFFLIGRFNYMYDFRQPSRDMVMEIYLKYRKTLAW